MSARIARLYFEGGTHERRTVAVTAFLTEVFKQRPGYYPVARDKELTMISVDMERWPEDLAFNVGVMCAMAEHCKVID